MNPQQQELLEKLKGANNILVTVSANPSVDQLAACIGMTLLLNKLKKHATAVFSGEVPSTIEFLKPEETLEQNTDSLRDFIISLDKSKADKLRYKVEDQVVRIFITPYRTSINESDLDFSQGDFNVDVVLCLGVNQQVDLDQAITAHGRILHDAVVISVNTQTGGELGAINWVDPAASSLSELVAELADGLGQNLLDSQIATALLTGIVAETERFSNARTSPDTMRISASLMAAGANQQLVASELEATGMPVPDNSEGAASGTPSAPSGDGTLEITHPEPIVDGGDEEFKLPAPQDHPEPEASEIPSPEDLINDVKQNTFEDDSSGQTPEPQDLPGTNNAPEPSAPPASRMMLQPPTLGGTLTANSNPEDEALQDPLSGDQLEPASQPLLSHDDQPAAPSSNEESSPSAPPEPSLPPAQPAPEPTPTPEPPAAPAQPEPLVSPLPAPEPPQPLSPPPVSDNAAASNPAPAADDQPGSDKSDDRPKANETLTELESSVHSPHVSSAPLPPPPPSPAPAVDDSAPVTADQGIEAARNAVMSAISSAPPTAPEPTAASGATGYLNVQDLPGIDDDTAPASNPPVSPPDLTDAAANDAASQPPTIPLPPAQPPAAPPVVPPAPSSNKSDAPPPVPPPLPLDDLSKFTSPSQ